MVVALQVTVEIFMFYKCGISSNGSQCTFLAFLIHPELQSESGGRNPCCIHCLLQIWKIIRFLLGLDALSFCLDLQTLRVCLDSQAGEVRRCPHRTPALRLRLCTAPRKNLRDSSPVLMKCHVPPLLDLLVGEESKWKLVNSNLN